MTENQERLIRMMFLFDETARSSDEGVELHSNETLFARQLSNTGCAYVEFSQTKGTGEQCIRFHGFTDRGRQVYGGFAPDNVQSHTDGVSN